MKNKSELLRRNGPDDIIVRECSPDGSSVSISLRSKSIEPMTTLNTAITVQTVCSRS